MKRPFGLAAIAVLGVTTAHLPADAETPPDSPLTVVAVLDQAPTSWPHVVDRGSFVFSQYDASGNAYDVVALNLHDQSAATLVHGIRDSRFLARDDRRIVVADPKPPATRVRVFDAVSGSVLASLNLRDGASWAHIVGEQLLLIQQMETSYGRSTKAVVFDLSTLKLVKSAELGSVVTASAWGEKVVVAGKDVRIYDAAWNQKGAIVFPSLPPTPTMSCAPFQLQVEDDYAVTTAGCNHIAVLDLKQRSVAQIIEMKTGPLTFAVAQRLIFAIPGNSRFSNSRARIFDLTTGRLMATLPIAGSSLLADGDRLLAIGSERLRKGRLTLYSVDAGAIRSGKWQDARIRDECTAAAEDYAIDKDSYAAVNRCDVAGIATLPRERWREPEFAPLVRSFGFWLSAGFDRYAEAIPLLEAMKPADGSDPELGLHLVEARLKVQRLDADINGALTTTERQTALGAVYSREDERLKSQLAPIEYGAFPDNFVLDADRIYVGRWSCGGTACEADGKPHLEVLDRATLRLIKSVTIPTEGDDEDSISSIAIHGGQIWVSTAYRWGDNELPNIFVIDPKSFAILRKGSLPNEGQALFSRDGLLLACDCGISGQGNCATIDAHTIAETSAVDWRCNTGAFSRSEIAHESAGRFPPFVEAVTPNYFVTREADGSEGYFFAVEPRGDTAAAPLLDKYTHRRFDWIQAIPGVDRLLVERSESEGMALLTYDIITGKAKMLGRFALEPRERFAIASDTRFAYLSLGRDLAIYDMAAGELRHYVRDFIPTGFDDNGNGIDLSGVVRLIVDGPRLIALTFNGSASRVLDLRQLDAKLSGR